VRERRPSAEGGCGWVPLPPAVPSADATLRGDEGGATESDTGVVPALPEGLTVGADDPLESVEGPLAEEAGGGLPAADSGGLPEGAGGLLVGGELTVEVPSDTLTSGVDTLTSGVPDEDVSGEETPIDGAPTGEAPSRDTLTKGALGADPSGSDTPIAEVCKSDTPTSGAPGEDAVEELDEAETDACAWAYPAVSSAVHRPASSPTAPVPTHRGRGPAIRLRLPW
jgi:hypothetical protein